MHAPDLDGDNYDFCSDCHGDDPSIRPDAKESRNAQNCEDGIDNDCDGLFDSNDSGCDL